MNPVLAIVLAWSLFSGAHFLLSSEPLRSRLITRFGERGFSAVFSGVAAIAFTALCMSGAIFREQGPSGLNLASHPIVRPLAIVAIFAGFALLAGSLVGYGRSPMAPPLRRISHPRGAAAISRHGFFYGLALWALAHTLLASTVAGALFFGGFVFHAVLGSTLQDRKLSARLGAPYRDYLAQSSALPFAAIASGRARFIAAEQPWLAYATGLLLAWLLREAHAHLFDFYGLYIVGVTLAGAAFATWSAERQAHRPEPSLG